MRTDTERCEVLLLWLQLTVEPESAPTTLTPEKAKTMMEFMEACEAGARLGMSGRPLLDAALDAVRFDVDPEKAREVTEQMVAERTDTELLNWANTELLKGRAFSIVAGTEMGSEVIRLSLIEGPTANNRHTLGINLRGALLMMKEFVEAGNAPPQAPDA